ncbi:unnamed protein product [Heligmosomoides polygyrus]|uniref:Uncharacterized protein n=1 Tax=Heligmosomoides polygyrus TaxID=6339 RepID=A0A3P8A110_HELPZ|nr:unnamed protein product [Heligmosomoides polygyrus]
MVHASRRAPELQNALQTIWEPPPTSAEDECVLTKIPPEAVGSIGVDQIEVLLVGEDYLKAPDSFKRRMESLESISPLTVRLVFHLFLYFEMSLHVVGFVVSSIFFIVFSRLRSIHTNLIIILDSFVLSFCVTSVWRVYYCLKLLILNIEPGDSALTLGTDMRDTCMYVGGLHMLLLAGERLVATIRSRTYENESHVPHICVTVCGMVGGFVTAYIEAALNNSEF